MNIVWGMVTVVIGLVLVRSSFRKSESIMYKLLVARSRMIWGKHSHKFLFFSGVLIVIVGILMLFDLFRL